LVVLAAAGGRCRRHAVVWRVCIHYWLLFSRALVVSNVVAVTVPPLLVLLRFFDAVDQRLHPHVVVAVGLHHVNEIEPIRFVFPRIMNSEEIPLRVGASSVVVLQEQVVLRVRNFDDSSQVTRLKSRFKH